MGLVDVLQSRLRALASADRAGQFVSVGAAGAALETSVVAALTAGLALQPLAAKLVGAEASISLMFLLNDRWTFAAEGDAGLGATIRRYVKSHTVRLGGLAVAFATLYVLTSWTDVTLVVWGADFWPTVANVLSIGAGMSLNYVAESLLTWRVHDSR
jgi:putative flippase GtrA